ncbi:MAG: HPr family phosphocarrier protein [Deltaproteobacteria bacterium]|nr:HPr family phosphocarrier protein [Deltaproteobacteria bacterium]
MKESKVTIKNELGLHARAAGIFAKEASNFSSDVMVIRDSMQVNGKSIMELLTLAASNGTEIMITADGDDETQAIKVLTSLVNQNFREER